MTSSVVSYVTPVKNYILNSSQGSLNSSQDSNTSAKLDLSGYQTSPATTPVGRDNKAGWYAIHAQHVSLSSRSGTEYILCGDSIVAGLSRYPRIWKKFFEPLKALIFGIGGDRTQHVLWRAENLHIPKTTKFVVLHCGTNNIDRDSAICIANGILSIAVTFQDKMSGLNVLVTGLLPRDLTESFRREKIRKVNKILKKMCRTKFVGIHFMKQDDDWIQEDGLINETLFYTDHLHLVEKGNEKFATSIKTALEKLKENGKLDCSSNEESGSDDEIEYSRQVAQRRKRFKDSDDDDYHHSSRHKRSRHSDEHHHHSRFSSSSRRSKHRRHTSSPKRDRSRSRSREKSEERSNRKRKSKWRMAREESSSSLKKMKEDKQEEEVEVKKQTTEGNDKKPVKKGGLLSGTAKSIDISSLDQKKRIEARKNKFAAPINPSALIMKIKASQNEARKDIELQKQRNRKIEITDGSDAKDIKKFFSDYTANSDSE